MRNWAGKGFLRIPEGNFIMGSKDDNTLAWNDERPQHILELPYDYWIAKYPVNNSDFLAFVQDISYITWAEKEGWCWVWNRIESKWEKTEGAGWKQPLGTKNSLEEILDFPVVQVCFYDALAYCEWLNEKSNHQLPEGYQYRLPSEAEWEKAARGPNGKEWPWGNEFDPTLCNSREKGAIYTVAVGTHSSQGDSAYGAADMSGNIWEWTITLWGDDRDTPTFVYPYDPNDGRENLNAGEAFFRVIRGGSYKDDIQGVRSACRDLDPPHYSLSNLGFRVFVAPIMENEKMVP